MKEDPQPEKQVCIQAFITINWEYKSDALPLGVCIDVYADVQGVPRSDDRISGACFKDHTKQKLLINYSDYILTYIPVYFTSLRMNRYALEIWKIVCSQTQLCHMRCI